MTKRKCWHEYPRAANGDMLSYPDWKSTMDEANPFDAELFFKGFTRGRSSALAVFTTGLGMEVPMFLSNLEEIFRLIKNGHISGRWIVVKKGQNYGIAIEELPAGAAP